MNIRRIFNVIGLAAMLTLSHAASAAPKAPAKAEAPAMRVIRINDHLLSFYAGRPAEGSVNPVGANWADEAANFVGVTTYVIHSGDSALVYDAYPSVEQARWVRTWLEKAGIRHFVLVNSHWHLDHVGGNAVYADSTVIATEKTRETLLAHQAGIEAGTDWGPPAIAPLKLPDVGITSTAVVMVGPVKVELRPVNIHSADGLVLLLPEDRLLLAGDTLEDTMTFIAEPESLPDQYRNMAEMKQWGFDRILPNHGNPDVIARGGYSAALIDMTRLYVRRMVEHAHDPDFMSQPIERFIPEALGAGTVSLWWAYRSAQQNNLAKVSAAWKDRPLPDFGP